MSNEFVGGTKFAHVTGLARNVRAVVLSELRDLSGWRDYRVRKGLKSNGMTVAEIIRACEDLGYDLDKTIAAMGGNWDIEGSEGSEGEDTNGMGANEGENKGEAGEGASFEGRDAPELIAEILAPASAHMTPHLAGLLPGLIKPLAEAAARGPRVETKVIVRGPPPAPGAWVPPCVNVKEWQGLGRAFGLGRNAGGAGLKHALEHVRVPLCDCVEAPKVDVDYVWSPEILSLLGAADSAGLNVWTFGPAGTGKTEGAAQYAARLKRPFIRIAIERTTEPSDLIGQEVLAKDGGMEWRDGKLTRAFRTPYCVILIDEPTLLRSGSLAVFQTALDTRRLYLPTGEIVEAAQGILVIAADNTAGVGDDSGRYVDTAAVNVAFLDRFAFRVAYDYLSAGQETTMLAHRSGLDAKAARIMVDYAGLTRSKAEAGALTIGVTPRRLLAWAQAVRCGIGSAKAFVSTVIQGSAPEDRETLLMIETSSLASDHAKIDALARGTWVEPVAGSETPREISATGQRFPDDNVDETL